MSGVRVPHRPLFDLATQRTERNLLAKQAFQGGVRASTALCVRLLRPILRCFFKVSIGNLPIMLLGYLYGVSQEGGCNVCGACRGKFGRPTGQNGLKRTSMDDWSHKVLLFKICTNFFLAVNIFSTAGRVLP